MSKLPIKEIPTDGILFQAACAAVMSGHPALPSKISPPGPIKK
jgi:hypothetical protein